MKIDKKLIVELEDWEVKEINRSFEMLSEEQKEDILQHLKKITNKIFKSFY